MLEFSPPHTVKINVDGSGRDIPGLVGAGVVLRDNLGCVITAKSLALGLTSNVHAELATFLKRLKLASSLGLQHLLI